MGLFVEIQKLRNTLNQLERIERRIIRTSGRLKGGPGSPASAALNEASRQIEGSRRALDQAAEELEVEDGLYSDGS